MAFGLPIRWRRITRGSAASRDVFLIPKISHIIRHCKFVSQGACIFLKNKKTSKRHVKLEQKTRRRKNLSLNRVFHKLDNNKWKMHTGARARKQKYISIYLSIYLSTWKPFWKRVYIYVLIQLVIQIACCSRELKRSEDLGVSIICLFRTRISYILYVRPASV